MAIKIILPTIAAIGFGFAVFTISAASRPPEVALPAAAPASAPFAKFIAGAGIVEPSSKIIAIGSPVARCVATVHVRVGEEVVKGAPLFTLDDRDLQAELAVRRTAVASMRAKLDRYEAMPRAEDVPPVQSRLAEAEARLADARKQLALAENLSDPRAIARGEVDHRRYEVEAAAARREQCKTELELVQAGAWDADVAVAGADLAAAQASLEAIEVEIGRMTVRAPIAGSILQLNVRPGEFAPAGALSTPLVSMGAVQPLHVRVDIDENDAWRFQPGASATASVRGNRDIGSELKFEYVEPYVVPKKSLTGDATERVDTRVMQVVFSFDRGAMPIQVGQQMDVFIEANGVESSSKTGAVNQ